MILAGQKSLFANGITFILFGFYTVYSSLFLALGKGAAGFFLGACRQGICFVPVILLLPMVWGMNGILYAQPIADRLLNPDSIQRIFLQDPDRALQLLDTAEQRDLPTLQPFDIAILRAMAYDVKRQYTQIEHYAQLALKDDSVRLVPKRRLRVMSLLLDAQGSLSKYDKCIKVCQEAVELARSGWGIWSRPRRTIGRVSS